MAKTKTKTKSKPRAKKKWLIIQYLCNAGIYASVVVSEEVPDLESPRLHELLRITPFREDRDNLIPDPLG